MSRVRKRDNHVRKRNNQVQKEDAELKYWNFSVINYILFALGVLVIISGYILMANSETNSFQATKLAPIILLIGYIAIIPSAILCKFSK